MPDAATVLLMTRVINQFTQARYTCEEVAAMDPIIWDLIEALDRGLNPRRL